MKHRKIAFFPINKKGQGNYSPLFIVLFIGIIVALLLNFVFLAFNVNTSIVNPDSSLSSSEMFLFITNVVSSNVFDFIPTGISIFGVNISVPVFNLLAVIPSMQEFIISQINIWTYVPSQIAIPFFIFFIIAFIWSSVKLFLP